MEPTARQRIVLAAMAPANGKHFQPVQIQKLFFLIDRKLGEKVGGPFFDFQPYHYGPFDSGVYHTVESLAARGLAMVSSGPFERRLYGLASEGQKLGEQLLGELDERSRDFIKRTCGFVLDTPFDQLVSSIYKAYPEMRAKSIFREPQ